MRRGYICDIEYCRQRRFKNGLCDMHWHRLVKYGHWGPVGPIPYGQTMDDYLGMFCRCERPRIEPLGVGVFAQAECCTRCHRPPAREFA